MSTDIIFIQKLTIKVSNANITSSPISMLSNVADKSVIAELISMDVSQEPTTAAEFTTLCPTSKTAIVMVNVLLTR